MSTVNLTVTEGTWQQVATGLLGTIASLTQLASDLGDDLAEQREAHAILEASHEILRLENNSLRIQIFNQDGVNCHSDNSELATEREKYARLETRHVEVCIERDRALKSLGERQGRHVNGQDNE